MKTTSLFTITGIVAFALLGISRFSGQTYQEEKSDAIGNLELAKLVKDQDYSGFLEVNPDMKFTIEKNTYTKIEDNNCEPAAAESGLCLDTIVFIEAEDTIDLGFDVNEYLPAGFDPYAKATTELDLTTVVFIEEDEFEGLGFDPYLYLPADFNPYAGMEPDLDAIPFIEEEEPVVLGFDTSDYLPEGFDPYALPVADLDEIVFITPEEPVVLGFDVNAYLPADFDPYAPAEFDLDQVIFIEAEDEIEIWEGEGFTGENAAYNY